MRRCDGIGRCDSFRTCHDRAFILSENGVSVSDDIIRKGFSGISAE